MLSKAEKLHKDGSSTIESVYLSVYAKIVNGFFSLRFLLYVEYSSDIADLKSHDIYNNKKKSNASLTFRWHW